MSSKFTQPLACYPLENTEKEAMMFDCNSDVAKRVHDPCSKAVLDQILGALGGAVSATKRIFNVPIPNADTEISLVLPTSIVGYMIRTRGNSSLKLSHVNGESGTNYLTIPARATHNDSHSYSNLTIYFQSPQAGDIVEVVAWEQ